MITRIRGRDSFRSPSNTERLQMFRAVNVTELANGHFRFTRASGFKWESETGYALRGVRRHPDPSGGIYHDPTDPEDVAEAARFEFGDF